MFKRLIPKRVAIKLIFLFADRYLLALIKNDEIKNFVRKRLKDLADVAGIYTDNDPDNRLQINMLWDARKSAFVADNVDLFERTVLTAQINKVQQPDLRTYLAHRWEEFEAIARILTDADPDNGAQMRQLWEQHRSRFLAQQLDIVERLIDQKMVDGTKKDAVVAVLATVDDLI